jgi:predicted ATPase
MEIKPLTVLLGANSSGKSSFGNAMAAMAHAQWIQNRPLATLTPPISNAPMQGAASWPVDLGRLDDLRTNGAQGPVYISLHTSEGWVKWGFGLDSAESENQDLTVSYIEQPGALDSTKHKDISDASQFQPISASGTISAGLIQLPEYKGLSTVCRRINELQWRHEPGDHEALVGMNGLTLDSVVHPRGGTNVLLNGEVRSEVQTCFRDLNYLRATRTRPTRGYNNLGGQTRQTIGYDGENTAVVLHRRGMDSQSVKYPPPIPLSSSEIPAALDKQWVEGDVTLIEALSFWLNHLKLARSVNVKPREDDTSILQTRVTLFEEQWHDITEVGFGISQVLPVLVAGLLQPKHGLFIVDLPEAHLHPRPQAELADFFCSLALGERQMLVETHSDMFVNQLRLRAEMTPELGDKIAIYFVDPPVDGCCCSPRSIELSLEGELRWPAEFMQESWEIETKISAAQEARRGIRK